MSINLRIAEAKGVKVYNAPKGRLCRFPKPMYGFNNNFIDYTADPALILELVIELGLGGWKYQYCHITKVHLWSESDGYTESKESNAVGLNDFGLCTATAWCEMKGIDYV